MNDDLLFMKAEEATKEDIKRRSDERPTYTADFENLVDLVLRDGKVCFLTANLDVKQDVLIDGKKLTPPPKENLPYLIPSADKVLQEIQKHSNENCRECPILYGDLLAYHKGISELPDPDYYHLLTLWTLHTYLFEKIHFSPMIYLFAVRERGKSRTLRGCIYAARRGIYTETLREPDLIRWCTDHKASIAFDTTNFPQKIKRAGCDDLILARFEKGLTSSRTLWPERGPFRDTKIFTTFGPTLIATNVPVNDILESRTFSIEMKPTSKKFNMPVLPEDGIAYRERLVAFQAAHFNQSLIEIDKPALGRLGDGVRTFYQVVLTFFPDKEQDFQRLLKKLEAQNRERALDSFEAQLVYIVESLEGNVDHGFLATEAVADAYNAGKKEQLQLSPDYIGRQLVALGFTRRRTSGRKGILYDPTLVNRLLVAYSLKETDENASVDSSAPEMGTSKEESVSVLTAAAPEDSAQSQISGDVSETPETGAQEAQGSRTDNLSELSNEQIIAKYEVLKNWLSKNENSPIYEEHLRVLKAVEDEGRRREMLYFLDDREQLALVNGVFEEA